MSRQNEAQPSYTGTVSGLRVTATIEGAHPMHTTYPLLRGDILLKQNDGTFVKFAPGLGIEGFLLTPEQEATLERVEDQRYGVGGMAYFLAAEPEASS
jgi:hypothetical protein